MNLRTMTARIRQLIVLLLVPAAVYAQFPDTLNKKRLTTLILSGTGAYTLTLVGLSQLWYEDFEKQSFTFFNDIHEWKQVDKAGHLYSSFQFSLITARALRWTGVQAPKSDRIGALTGFMMMVPIEIMDGFSTGYGASGWDLFFNAAGSGLYLAETVWWKEPRLHPKFSFHRTDYAAQRPDVLGDTFMSEMIKDYNGQTYWLSVDMDKFIRFPKWLNLAAGYGAEDMIYANDESNEAAGYDPYRQYYLGLDIDLTAIESRSKAVRTALFFLNMIRLPAPAVEFSRKGVKLYGLYF